jgi:hypothetical protein
MSELATIASKTKKPSKVIAQDIVRNLAKQHPECMYDLAALYTFFMESPKAKPKTNFAWVTLAMAKSDVRPYLNFVYVDDEYIVGSDGHRLHMAPSDGREPGFYNLSGDRVEFTGYKYPDYKRLIRKDFTCSHEIAIDSLPVVEIEPLKIPSYSLEFGNTFAEKRTLHIQKKYLDQATVGHDVVLINFTDDLGAIRIDMGTRTAVIMPIREQ